MVRICLVALPVEAIVGAIRWEMRITMVVQAAAGDHECRLSSYALLRIGHFGNMMKAGTGVLSVLSFAMNTCFCVTLVRSGGISVYPETVHLVLVSGTVGWSSHPG